MTGWLSESKKGRGRHFHDSRGRNWVAGGHSMMIQYCLDVLLLGKGDSAHILVLDDLNVEYPTRFSKVCGRKNGGNLFLKHMIMLMSLQNKSILSTYTAIKRRLSPSPLWKML
jgi:hypothetical protein